MFVRKRTGGTEAQRILGELARIMENHAGVTVRRLDGDTLELAGAEHEADNVKAILDGISPTWPTHVQLD